jgi:hypothetical protein
VSASQRWRSIHPKLQHGALSKVNGGDDVMPCDRARIVFLNGFMHVVTVAEGTVVVDMDGKT